MSTMHGTIGATEIFLELFFFSSVFFLFFFIF